ncbi:MAG TPA: START domain-containing protein [Spirochaetota bacterium]|nr:START domain-containing protein [Spirochaetota bacterium]
MKRIEITALLGIAALIATLVTAAPALCWTTELNTNGIRVYSRQPAKFPFKEYRGIVVIDAKLEVLGEVLRDPAAFPQWMANCTSASIVTKIDRNNMTLRIVLSMPAPVSDRDIVVEAKTVYDLATARGIVKLRALADSSVPADTRFVRITTFAGQYLLEYIGREKTRVVYTLRTDPRVGMPAFVVNSYVKDYAYKTLDGMRRMAAMGKYVAAGAVSPDRPIFDKTLKDPAALRRIMNARMREFIRDPLVSEIVATDAGIVNIVMRGGGSFASVKESFKRGCALYLAKKHGYDARTVEAAVNNTEFEREILNAILYGSEAGRFDVDAWIKKRIGK